MIDPRLSGLFHSAHWKPSIPKPEQNLSAVSSLCWSQNFLFASGSSRRETLSLLRRSLARHRREETAGRNYRCYSKKARTIKKKDHLSTTKDENLLDNTEESKQEEVYEMSSGDEDCSRGMKKWIMKYHKSRLGLDILQERIDAFVEAHEEQEKQAREEREALAAEGGWTVVIHHKGRKKTTDAESGIAVGSVAQAAVLENMAKKKKNEVGLDFYRFQKRDAKRSEIMALQSKFEQDKKRIQQLRAARKFRPY